MGCKMQKQKQPGGESFCRKVIAHSFPQVPVIIEVIGLEVEKGSYKNDKVK